MDMTASVRQTGGAGGILIIMHGRSRVTIDPRILTITQRVCVLHIMHGRSRMTTDPRGGVLDIMHGRSRMKLALI